MSVRLAINSASLAYAPFMRQHLVFSAIALALVACAPPVEQSDAAPDRAATTDGQSDSRAPDDTGVAPMDAGNVDTGIVTDTGVPPMDTGIRVDTGVPPRDTGVRDTGLPPCTLDPNNCGMCGRVCGQGALSGRPACAEVSTGRWDCVNNCSGFGEGCGYPGGGGVCCASGCALGVDGCR